MIRKSALNHLKLVLIGVLAGLPLPILLIILDLLELELSVTPGNIADVFSSQLIYPFTFIAIPTLCISLSYFFQLLHREKVHLKEVSEFNDKVLNNINTMIFVCNEKGDIIFINQALDDYIVREGIFDHSFKKFLETTNFFEKIGSSIVTNKIISLSWKEGEENTFKISSIPLYNGNIVYQFYSINDVINYQKTIEVQKQKMMVASRLSSLGEMASSIAHEINNPLAIIKGKAMILQKDMEKHILSDDDRKKHMTDIFKTIDRISRIINSLRRLSRGGDTQEELVELSVKSLVDDVYELAMVRAKNLIPFNVDYHGVADELIKVRRIELGQVLVNLLNNSFDAIADQPNCWVRLDIYLRPDGFHFECSDSGTGLTPEVVAKLFNPLFTTKEIGKGTGLGLSLSKSIIEAHRGRIYYDGTSPNTKFVFTIPKLLKTVVA